MLKTNSFYSDTVTIRDRVHYRHINEVPPFFSCLFSKGVEFLRAIINPVKAFHCRHLGTLSIDNEMHDDDVRNPRRIGSRVSFLVGKRKVKQCVVLRRRRLLVLRLVALAMAFKNVRNVLLLNHNDAFIDDDEFVLLYDLFVSKNLDFP